MQSSCCQANNCPDYVTELSKTSPSPSTVHKPYFGPSFLSLSLLLLLCCPLCYILLWLRVLWHLSFYAFWLAFWDLLPAAGFEGSSGASSRLPTVSQLAKTLLKQCVCVCIERDKWHVRYYSRAVKASVLLTPHTHTHVCKSVKCPSNIRNSWHRNPAHPSLGLALFNPKRRHKFNCCEMAFWSGAPWRAEPAHLLFFFLLASILLMQATFYILKALVPF